MNTTSETSWIEEQIVHPGDAGSSPAGFHGLVGRCAALRRVLHCVETVAATDAAVLIRGETGTGKELIASAVHYRSKRRDKLFVAQNCAAFP